MWKPDNSYKTRAGRPKWMLVKAGVAYRTAPKGVHRPEGVVWTCDSMRKAENKIDELNGVKPRWTSQDIRNNPNNLY